MALLSNKKEGQTFMRANPMIRGLQKANSVGESEQASYNGVFKKTGFFILLSFVGYILYNLLHRYIFAQMFSQMIAGEADGFSVSFSVGTIIFLVLSLIVCIVCPIVASRSPKLAPVFGGIYSLVQGFLISLIITSATSSGRLKEIGGETIALFAFAATGLIVFLMAFLYKKRILKATKKFMSILLTAAFASILLSLVVFVLALIPATQSIVAVFVNNPFISICCTVFGLILASLFLISDFAVIEQTVENGLEKKYEWTAAFGLVITIIWIYLKVLELIIKIFGSRD